MATNAAKFTPCLVFCVGLLAACSGARPPRPNLPPPEYEEPAGVLAGVQSLVTDAATGDAAAPTGVSPTP
jgi:hypothetical protein